MDLSDIAFSAMQIIAPVGLAALTWVATKVAALIKARVSNEYLRGVLLRLDDAVFAAVREVHQVAVEGIKSANSDGRLTPNERAQVKAHAIATIKSHLGVRGLKEVAHVMGLNTGSIDGVLSTRIEAAVHDLKRARVSNGVSHSTGGDFVPFGP
ncbi:MAG TPA: hypothetical protein VGF45_19565 [Polyangia bacterium]